MSYKEKAPPHSGAKKRRKKKKKTPEMGGGQKTGMNKKSMQRFNCMDWCRIKTAFNKKV